MKKYFIKYSFEFVVIIFGILISLFLEQRRQNSIEIERKNNTIKQLISVIDADLNQINTFIDLQSLSLKSSNVISKNLNNNYFMKEDSIMYHLSSIGRGLKSFFPQQGIFNQMVSSDLIKMIDSDPLKTKLFKLYNEDLVRHDVHTKEYDKYFLEFNYNLSINFFLVDDWEVSGKDPIKILSYKFNKKYYKSNKMYGDIIELKSSIIEYIQELNMLKDSFLSLKNLCLDELE